MPQDTAQSCDCQRAAQPSLQHAYQGDEVRLVRRITVLLDLLVHQVPVEVLSTMAPQPLLSSTTGVRPFCCGAWTAAWSIAMAGGAQRS